MSDPAGDAANSQEASRQAGLIPFFARNRVAGNLLMVVLLGGGLYTIPRLPVENIPDMDARRISVVVPYPGGSPAEVEESITRRIEENVLVVGGVDRVTTTAVESLGKVMIDVRPFAVASRVLDDVRTAVERIERFPPPDAEQPEVALVAATRNLMTVAVTSSSLSENGLREVAEQVQEDLLALPSVSMVTPFGTKEREISIEVDEEALREHRLTISAVSRRIRESSLNLSSGELRTGAGGFVLRTNTKRVRGEDFEDIVLLAHEDGTIVQLRDVAQVSDGFADIEALTRVNGRPSVLIQINRDGDQEPLDIAREVRQLLAGYQAPLSKCGMIATAPSPHGLDFSSRPASSVLHWSSCCFRWCSISAFPSGWPSACPCRSLAPCCCSRRRTCPSTSFRSSPCCWSSASS